MKRTTLLAGAPLALVAALAIAGPAPAKPLKAAAAAPVRLAAPVQPTAIVGAEQSRIVAAASAALNRLTALEGRFLQINPDGARAPGSFWMQRPGRLRFEYDAPNPLVVVADGATVAVEDRALKSVDRVPLRSTPLHFVLKRDIDLARDARVTRVWREGDATLIALRDRTGESDGQITLAFVGPNLALERWTVLDGDGRRTELMLQDARPASRIDPQLFRTSPGSDPTARQRTR